MLANIRDIYYVRPKKSFAKGLHRIVDSTIIVEMMHYASRDTFLHLYVPIENEPRSFNLKEQGNHGEIGEVASHTWGDSRHRIAKMPIKIAVNTRKLTISLRLNDCCV